MESIDEILNELGIDFLRTGHHHCRPGWIQLRRCPFCSSDNYHLGFNVSVGFFSCWRCGGHSAWKVWEALGCKSPREVLRRIALGDTQEREIPRISLQVPSGVAPMLPAHRRYLRDRGFDPEEVVRIWNVEGIGIAPRLGWRLFIPITYRGDVVSWTTRAIGNSSQRYISASAEQERINHKHLIYGQDYCHHSIIVVEGPIDAWKVGPGAGALFGTAFTTAQVKKILEHPYRFIVFDSSSDAQQRAEELAEQLSPFPGVTQTVVLDAEDPGSASDREIKRLRKAARL